MKSVREFAAEVKVDAQVVNNSLVRRGVYVKEDIRKNDGYFSMELYESYQETVLFYEEQVKRLNIDNERSKSVPLVSLNKPLIYILFDEGKIVYIGQSVNLFSRINEHNKNKKFSEIAVFEFNKEHLDIMEMMLILKFTPIYNIDGSHLSLFSFILKKVI